MLLLSFTIIIHDYWISIDTVYLHNFASSNLFEYISLVSSIKYYLVCSLGGE